MLLILFHLYSLGECAACRHVCFSGDGWHAEGQRVSLSYRVYDAVFLGSIKLTLLWQRYCNRCTCTENAAKVEGVS